MTTDALTLAALATAALPGLRAIRAEAVHGRAGERFQVGFVEDAEHRRWVVRVPADAVAAARQDASITLLGMLARRVPFGVPAPKGFAALKDGRRAMVYPLISGHALNLFALPAGRGLAVELGRTLAALHNTDRRLFEEAAVPSYDAEECRHRHLVLLDRGAQTGSVPVGLLARWERMLDDVSLWRFAPAAVHGRLDGPHVLAAFSSSDDAASGRIRAIVGWEDAHVGDPAQDFAALLAQAAPETVDTVFEAYAMSRLEHPDPHLETRARLIAELRLVEDLLAATSARDERAVAAAVQALRRLDAEVGDPADEPRGATPPQGPASDDAQTPGPVYRAGAPDPGLADRWFSEDAASTDRVYTAGAPRPPAGLAWQGGAGSSPAAPTEEHGYDDSPADTDADPEQDADVDAYVRADAEEGADVDAHVGADAELGADVTDGVDGAGEAAGPEDVGQPGATLDEASGPEGPEDVSGQSQADEQGDETRGEPDIPPTETGGSVAALGAHPGDPQPDASTEEAPRPPTTRPLPQSWRPVDAAEEAPSWESTPVSGLGSPAAAAAAPGRHGAAPGPDAPPRPAAGTDDDEDAPDLLR